jgi:hypothetical protein
MAMQRPARQQNPEHQLLFFRRRDLHSALVDFFSGAPVEGLQSSVAVLPIDQRQIPRHSLYDANVLDTEESCKVARLLHNIVVESAAMS